LADLAPCAVSIYFDNHIFFQAFKNDSSFNFMVFFFVFFAQFCYTVLMALGIPKTGGM
jgi:SCAMP family